MSETVNIVEAKIKLMQMREELDAIPCDLPDPKEREKRWYLSMNVASFAMAIEQHDGTYIEPWKRNGSEPAEDV